MLSLLKKEKSPAEFLDQIRSQLDSMTSNWLGTKDAKQLKFLQKHMSQILAAMEQVADNVAHYKDQQSDIPAVITKEWSSGFLYWNFAFLKTLKKEGAEVDGSNLSESSVYFLENTQEKTQAAFDELFELNPVAAFGSLHPAGIFGSEIDNKMQSLIHHDDPSLFFECREQIYLYHPFHSWNNFADTPAFSKLDYSLTIKTEIALGNMLKKDPNAVLFPSVQQNINRHARNYLHYLTFQEDKRHIRGFVNDNIDGIEVAVRAVAKNASEEHFADFKTLYDAYSEDGQVQVPPQLETLKTLLLSECVKMCFRMAAGDQRHILGQALAPLENQQTPLVKKLSWHAGGEMTSASCEFFYLTNPSPAWINQDKEADSKPQNKADSRNLLVLKKEGIILAAAFTEADLVGFLETQAQYPKNELPTAHALKQLLFVAYGNIPEIA